MLKNIIFDCSDTLLCFDAPAWFATLTGDAQRAQHIVTAIMKSPVWYCYDNGTATQEDVEREVLATLNAADHHLVRRYLAEWMEHYTPIAGMPQLLADLKARGYRLFLLSDFPDCFPRLTERFDFLALFDGIGHRFGIHYKPAFNEI